jgi:choline dehydrogenase
MAVCHLRPQSRGHVRLGAGGIGATPSIQPCYLDAAEDRRAMVTGVRLARKIFAAPEMKRFSAREFVPGPTYQTDEQIEKAVAQTASSIFHPVGTCKMGHDPLAVVDDRLKVRGIGGVRVADASVMPLIISANTNAAVVMIAEKAADLIRADGRGVRP